MQQGMRTVAEAAAEMKQEIKDIFSAEVECAEIFFAELAKMAPRYGGVPFGGSPFEFGGTVQPVTFFAVRFSEGEEDALLLVVLSRKTYEYAVMTNVDEDWPDEFEQFFGPILKAAREVEAEQGIPTSTKAN